MSKNPIYYSVIAALSGFLFGLDTIVISGANLPLKELWNSSEWFHGFFIMSVALWGTLLGAIFGNIPCDKLGRRSTLFWISVFYFISAIGTALATDAYFFSMFRFLGGVAIGVSTIAAPTYISEIAPYKFRGKLVGLFQMNIVVGILLAFVSNYLLSGVGGHNDWRLMLGIEAIPALLFLILVLNIPESPRWLIIRKKKLAQGLKILNEIFGENHESPETILRNIRNEQAESLANELSSTPYRNTYILAFLMAFFNQASGVNFILYYAPEILEKTGLAKEDSLFGAVLIGVANMVFTILGLILIDKIGRRLLMIVGSFGYLISLTMIILGFYTQADPVINLLGIIIFMSSHALGQGTVIWVFISEIFPNRQRATGQSFGAGVHWGLAALVTLFGSALISQLQPWQIFSIFLVFMVFQTVFVIGYMPETKGRPLEQVYPEARLFRARSPDNSSLLKKAIPNKNFNISTNK
ncbi:MAG: MFS transporter [Cytophagales bacterium]|nr:MAG: MFS transporter [Cytophagales bacterium]